MNIVKYCVKFLWWISRNGQSHLKLLYYQLLSGTFFHRVGRGTKFFGSIRFGSVEGNISVGRNCWIGHEAFFSASRGAFIRLGEKCSINTGCHLVAVKGITIGDGTRIGEYCSIRDQNHNFDDFEHPIHDQGFNARPIIIGKDVWLGRGVFVGSGVKIGDGCVIGANSVVLHDIPPFSVAVGAPARVVRKRGDSKQPNENLGFIR